MNKLIFTLLLFAVPALAQEPNSTLITLVDFNDSEVACTQADLEYMMWDNPSGYTIDELWKESSAGKVSFEGDVVAGVVINQSAAEASCNPWGWGSEAKPIVTGMGYDPDDYDRRVWIFPSNTQCAYGGWGQVGGEQTDVYLTACVFEDVIAHEFGHNEGLGHAARKGKNQYSDTSDIMGGSGRPLRHTNAPHKVTSGWVPDGNLDQIFANGRYRLSKYALTEPNLTEPQVYMLVTDDTVLYFSFRTPTGFDEGLAYTYKNKLHIHEFDSDNPSSLTLLLGWIGPGETYTHPESGIIISEVELIGDEISFRVQYACCTNGCHP